MIFHSLTFARSRGRCWKPRAKPEVFNISRGTLQMLMNDKTMFDCYYCINSKKTHRKLRKCLCTLLAHLSRRLTRWAYSIPMVRRPSSSVVVVRRRPHFKTWISLKPVGQSWSNFMCSITGVGERLHKVLWQIGSKLWLPWQQKAPIDL